VSPFQGSVGGLLAILTFGLPVWIFIAAKYLKQANSPWSRLTVRLAWATSIIWVLAGLFAWTIGTNKAVEDMKSELAAWIQVCPDSRTYVVSHYPMGGPAVTDARIGVPLRAKPKDGWSTDPGVEVSFRTDAAGLWIEARKKSPTMQDFSFGLKLQGEALQQLETNRSAVETWTLQGQPGERREPVTSLGQKTNCQ
jgi:hypothetical protein